MRKPTRGVCSTCGAPVVAPTQEEIDAVVDKPNRLDVRQGCYFEVNGHLFEMVEGEGWKLKSVGCSVHKKQRPGRDFGSQWI